MASDLSSIFKNELANTLEQLLGKKATVEDVIEEKTYDSDTFIECDVKFDFKGVSTGIMFYIPNQTATNFEYLMLGGMGDLKDNIDDETTDAVNEIISNICGSFCTSVNAQGLADVSGIKSEVKSSKMVEKSVIDKKELFVFKVSLEEQKTPLIVVFDKLFKPFFSTFTGEESSSSQVAAPQVPTPAAQPTLSGVAHPSKNLELLYNVRLKLSVRLGTRIVLLKDILRWDVGEIIELEQMVNEPLEILINGVKIGEGEAVIVEGKFGLKIKRIIHEDFKIDKIGL